MPKTWRILPHTCAKGLGPCLWSQPEESQSQAGSCHTVNPWRTQTWRARIWSGCFQCPAKDMDPCEIGKDQERLFASTLIPLLELLISTLYCCGYPTADLTPWQGTSTATGIPQHQPAFPALAPDSPAVGWSQLPIKDAPLLIPSPGLSSTLIASG